MALRPVVVRAPVWVTLALVAAGCGDSSFSPASPSLINRASTTGAVISGTVTGMTAQVTSSLTATTRASVTRPVTVRVVGTDISSTIDGSGRFQLNNVPPGDVALRFTGEGFDATLTVRDVETGDRIDIRVRVTDSSVRIDAERRDRNGDDGDDGRDDDGDGLEGVVSGLLGTCPDISFMVRRTLVRADDRTRYEDGTCSRVRNDRRLDVHGVRQFDGLIQATRIEFED
jgi:hypothetical protein